MLCHGVLHCSCHAEAEREGVPAQTLDQVQGYNNTAHNVNSIYRPLAIALLFGLIMLASLLVCVCACIGRTPRLTAFLLLILWLFSGAILFIGTGALGDRSVALHHAQIMHSHCRQYLVPLGCRHLCLLQRGWLRSESASACTSRWHVLLSELGA